METKICKKCGRELPLEMFDESRHQCIERFTLALLTYKTT